MRWWWLVLCLAALAPLSAVAQASAAAPAQVGVEPVSRDAQRAYASAREKLVQIRTLVRNTDAQSSVGSGFFVSSDGLILTNFHVASQLALEPERYRGVYVPVDGKQAELELLAFDVLHDLAVLRVKRAEPSPHAAPWPALVFRSPARALARGERLYSLGNPLDIGFAVTEGTYNGLVQRSFYPRIFFGGAINPGMSGGPVLDDNGEVIGVNVSKRLDGELLSFLVPAEFAQALLAQAKGQAQPITTGAQAEVTRQLLAHQEALTRRFTSTPFKVQRYHGYSLPVPDDAMARCWGRSRDADLKSYEMDSTNCQLDAQLFAGELTTGFIRLRHTAYDAPRLGAMRFAKLYSQHFRSERVNARGNAQGTASECTERYVETGGVPMRAVVCLLAYRKLRGLYDMSVVVTSLNRPTQGVRGRLDAYGVGFDNGLKLAAYYVDAFKWDGAQ
ncbi:trypsin [Rhodoferax koreense]|uniref:Trypsin n=2 Tax=Rhodoferax koreensis TaxID=1842727 RepID=A0A1P8K4C3_9BURK|nr:trypsin [Rhodoferax koreense]